MKQLKKTFLTLVALLALTTGAWAGEEPQLLTTINASINFMSGSKTFDDKVTVTFSNFVYYDGEEGWYADESLLTVAGTNGYTITSCKFYTANGEAETGYTIEGESPSVYLSAGEVYTDANQSVEIGYQGITKIEVYGTAPSAASSGPEVAWTAESKTGTFNMPGGNVTLEPDYYPQATADGAVTAADADARATTDDPLVKVDATKLTGAKKLMYFVSNSGTTAPAYDAEGWTDQLPTAEKFTEAANLNVWYYPVGADDDDPAKTYSDGDMNATALSVTIAAAPTYAVTFAEGTPETDKWKAEPNAGVTKGKTVTVTYTGSKKVLGVKAEKKASTPSLSITNPVVGQVIGSDGKNYAAANVPSGVDKVAMIAYVSGSNGLAIALADEGFKKWATAISTCEAKTPAFTNGTWKLPSQDEWKQMFSANGGNEESYDGLNTAITTAGGTAFQDGTVSYWSSSENDSDQAHLAQFYYGYPLWFKDWKTNERYVRACLAF